jgi:hypothetical protein
MRFYLYRPGSPGFVVEEIAIMEATFNGDRAQQARLATDRLAAQAGDRILSVEEMLTTPETKDALRRWRAHEDDAFESREVAEHVRDTREEMEAFLREHGACPDVAFVVDATWERQYDFLRGHGSVCDHGSVGASA